jgi:cell division protein FtsB
MPGFLETKKSSFFLKILLLSALVALVMIAQSLIRETYKKNQISREIAELEKQAQEIDRENYKVEERLAYLESEEYKKKEVKDKLGLRDPGEFVVFVKPRVSQESAYPSMETPAIPAAAANDLPMSNPVKWWKYFFN